MKGKRNVFIEASNIIDAFPTGIPTYSSNLINQLVNNKDFNEHCDPFLLLSASRWKKRHLCSLFNEVQRVWYVRRFIFKKNVDLIHYTGVFNNPFRKVPKIITIHDLAVLKPEHQIPYYTTRETIHKTRENMSSIVKHIDAIIFVSETTRQDFLELYSFPFEKTSVIYLGSQFATQTLPETKSILTEKYKIRPKKYFLFVGGLSIRKNVLNLVKAFLSKEDRSGFDLVLVGSKGMGADLILDEIQKNDKHGRIRYTGFISDREIGELYRNAGAFVFPSYYEGFGMPVIDAMNFGIPVLTSNKGASPEISGKLATLVDPFHIDSISEGLDRVLVMDPEILTREKIHAQNFTWEKCARETFQVYRQFLA